jgi:HD-like signal output (HDOD) protein
LPTTGDTKFQPAPGPAQPSNLQRVSVSKADAIVQKVKDLPPLPSLVTKALSMLADPSTDLEAVAAVIGKDQALVAKLIKVSNSVLYGRVQKVGTLKQALTRLGSKIVKSLILSASTRGYFLKNSSGMGAWGQLLWQHTVECGLAARRVANAFAEQDPEDAFIGGILHDIGKLAILLIHPEKYKAIQKTVRSGNVPDIQAEINILGCSHEEIGYLLLDQWRMPDTAKVCARFHHSLEKAGEFKKLASIVAYGNYFSRTYGAHPQAVFQANGEPLTDPTHLLEIAEDMQTAIREDILTDFASADFFT